MSPRRHSRRNAPLSRHSHAGGGVVAPSNRPHLGRPQEGMGFIQPITYQQSREGEQSQLPDIAPGAVDGSVHIFPASLIYSLFAADIIPPIIVSVLPTLPDATYPQGVLAFLTSDQKLYRNTDGSTWSVAVDGADIVADSIVAGSIAAGAIGATELAAVLVLASVIKTADTGARVELDINGFRAYSSAEDLLVQIPTDGSPVYVNGQILATELLVTGNAVLRGTANALALGSLTQLDAAQAPPSGAPTLAQGWDTITAPADAAYDFSSTIMFRKSLHYDSAGGAGGATKVFWMTAKGAGSDYYLVECLATDRTVSRAALINSDNGTQVYAYGAARLGSHVYVLLVDTGLDFDPDVYRVKKYLASDMSLVTTYSSVSFPITQRQPVITSDGTNIFIVDKASGTANIKWNKYDSSMVKVGSTIDTSYSSGSGDYVVAAAAGSFDIGAFRVAVMTYAGTIVNLFDSTGARQANESFRVSYSGSSHGGVTYGDALGDGARFWTCSMDGTSPAPSSITKHTTWTWTTASSIYWVGYTWYDSVGTTHETTVGTRASITTSRRKKLTITMAALPGAGGADEPNNWRVYMFPNATAPATTSLDLQSTGAVATVVLRTYDNAGAAPPVTNNFPAGSSAEFKAAGNEWSFKGDGTVSMPTIRVERITSSQVITTATGTTVIFNSIIREDDTAGIMSHATGTGILTTNREGWYEIFAGIAWGAGATGDRQLAIQIDGATVAAIRYQAAAATNRNAAATLIYLSNASHTITVECLHTQGANVNLLADAASFMAVRRVG